MPAPRKMRRRSSPPGVASSMSLTPEAIATLSRVTTATITTVLLKKGLRNVWLRGARPLRPGQDRVVGPAFTLRFVPAREDLATPESWNSPISTRAAIEAMPPGSIAIVDVIVSYDDGAVVMPKALVIEAAAEAAEQERFEAGIVGEVQAGAARPAIY